MRFISREKVVDGDTQFFKDLGQKIDSLSADCRQRVMTHVDYLAAKAGRPAEHLLQGSTFQAHQAVILDAIHNITAEIGITREGIGEHLVDTIQRSRSLPGWCSVEKASIIAELVRAEQPKICVEIGIFGGRSLIPCAATLRENGGGVAYGIETWSPSVATEHVTDIVNDDWWRGLDFASIKAEFLRFVVDNDLVNWIRLIEAPSADAASLFRSIDYLHIDGAHSVFNAAEDAILYLKRLRSGGIVILDDVNWKTTAPAYEILKAICDPVTTIKDEATGVDACAVLRKR